MSIALDLGICAISQGLPRGSEAAQTIAAAIAAPFATGSGGDIALSPHVVDGTAAGISIPATVQSDHLHRSLEAITGRQRNKTKVTNIGILLAGRFEPRRDFFGLMFDEAFIPGTSDPWVSTPREGCAVFLSAIADKRSDADFLNEVIYTAVHELGHVVNLQHSPEPSFMATSAQMSQPFPLASREFNSLQKDMLSSCSTSRFVWPGGSVFGDLGPFAATTSPVDAAANAAEPLELRVGMEQDTFWQFEPVELDIELSLRPNTQTRMLIPDMVDPGYRRFTIWIEDPGGERRRYLSPRHYCAHQGRICVSVERPIRRDVSIFGQSGGFCFQRAGMHKIFVTYELRPRRVVRSNVLQVLIRAPSTSDYYKAAKATMTDKDLGQLMYYRNIDRTRHRKVHRLAHLCEAYPRQAAVANAHYAIGRAYARVTHEQRQAGQPSLDFARTASAHLKAAVRRKSLGDHRRAHAERALELLPSTKLRNADRGEGT